MKRKNAETIGDVMRTFFNENNLEAKILEHKLYKIWPLVLGEEMASYTSNLYVKNRILYVSVASSVLRNELMMSRNLLVRNLNQQIGADLITNIIFR